MKNNKSTPAQMFLFKNKIAYIFVGLVIASFLTVAAIRSSSAFDLIPPPPVPPVKVYVATAGKDTNDGKTVRTPVRSIKRALALGANTVVLVGRTYELPLTPEHSKGGGFNISRSLLVVSDQTPWEHSPSSSKGGWTEILPAKRANGQMDSNYRFLKFRGGGPVGVNQTPPSVAVKFIRFKDTELHADNLPALRYHGD